MAAHIRDHPVTRAATIGALLGAALGLAFVLVSGGSLPAAVPILSLAVVGGSTGALVGLGRRR